MSDRIMKLGRKCLSGALSVLLLFSMMFSISVPAAFAGSDPGPVPGLEITDAAGAPGEPVTVAVYLNPGDAVVYSYDIELTYDPTALELDPAEWYEDEAESTEFDADDSIPGTLKVNAEEFGVGGGYIFQDGEKLKQKLFTLRFNIKSTAAPGDVHQVTAASASYIDLGDSIGDAPHEITAITPGTVTIAGTADHTAPTVVDATYSRDLAIDANLELTFDEAVSAGSGNLYIMEDTADSVPVTIDVSDPSRVSVAGAVVTIDPPADLKGGTAYYVLVEPGTFVDGAGNAFTGIGDKTTWPFATARQAAPGTVQAAVGAASGEAGGTATVAFSIADSSAGVASYGIRIDFDPSVLAVASIDGDASGDWFESHYDNTDGWLKAAWTDDEGGDGAIESGDLFEVKFNIAAGADVGVVSELTVEEADVLSFTMTDAEGVEFQKTLTAGGVTVVAGQQHQNTYNVVYDGNGNTGGDVPADNGSYAPGDTVTILGNTGQLVRAGYMFHGWNTAADGSGSKFKAGDTFTMGEANVALYAVWNADQQEPNTYGVVYNGNGNTGGGVPIDSGSYASGDSVTVLGNIGQLVKAGYTFHGWNTAADGSGAKFKAGDTFTMGEANVTLYAVWNADQQEPSTYGVVYNGNGNTGGDVPIDSGSYAPGDAVTILGNTGQLARAGYTFHGWNTAADGSGATYAAGNTFVMGQANATLYAVWNANGNNNTGNTGNSGSVSQLSGVDVLVNGKAENAGTATTVETDGRKVTTIAIDEEKLLKRLEAEGDGAVLTIPVAEGSDVVIGELNGRMVKSMENKLAVVEIRTGKASYTLPAGQINIDAISEQLGESVQLQDIKVRIEIAEPSAETVRLLESAEERDGFTAVAPTVSFSVKAVYGDTTIEVSKFNSYVKRAIAIPEGVDPSRITTGIVIEPDGTVRHVPTKIVELEGVYYAQISSLTNSAYSVVWNPLEFADAAGHWAEEAINNMGSRLIVNGTGGGTFSPDQDITRAEFAAIIIRGLGLRLENGGDSVFSDVTSDDWYAGAVRAAHEYRLIDGFEDGTFRPNDPITREQAMLIVSRAMEMTQLPGAPKGQAAKAIFGAYSDAGRISVWALDGVADSVSAGIITGRSGDELAPDAYITRAEVAMTMQRLLLKSDLINPPSAR